MRLHKNPCPIPIAYKILSHPKIFNETLAQLNTMVRLRDVPSELDHTLQEWPARGNNLASKIHRAIRDCSSLSVQDLLPLNSVKQEVRRWTLSGGRRASMPSESRTIPMNSRVVEWPCVSWGVVGIPRLKESNMLDKLCWQAKLWGAIGDGGSITRKSTKMWQTKEMPQWLRRSHSTASESWLNRKGALVRPTGRTLSQ